MSGDWLWVAVICAVPFLIFGAMEGILAARRRRLDAVARRSKTPPQSSRR